MTFSRSLVGVGLAGIDPAGIVLACHAHRLLVALRAVGVFDVPFRDDQYPPGPIRQETCPSRVSH